jgi:hypothetical protein
VVGIFSLLLAVITALFSNSPVQVPTPLFEAYVNDISSPIRSNAVVKLGKNRTVQIRVQNVSQVAADNVSVSVYIPLEPNDLVFTGWTMQAPPINPKRKQEVTDLIHLWSVAAGIVPEHGWFQTPILSIPRDLPAPKFTRGALEEFGFKFSVSVTECPEDFVFHVLPIIVSINSARSTDHRFNLFLY